MAPSLSDPQGYGFPANPTQKTLGIQYGLISKGSLNEILRLAQNKENIKVWLKNKCSSKSHGTRKGISWLTSLNAPAVISIKLESFLLQRSHEVTRSMNLQVLICDRVSLWYMDSLIRTHNRSITHLNRISRLAQYHPQLNHHAKAIHLSNNNLHSTLNNHWSKTFKYRPEVMLGRPQNWIKANLLCTPAWLAWRWVVLQWQKLELSTSTTFQ